MCGIVALVHKTPEKGTLNKLHIDMFKQLLYADALRGWDSTGIAAIGKQAVTVVKDACTPSSLFFRNQDHTWCWNKIALVGHNRAATRGATVAENAHPFKEGPITLVHNGTLREHHSLKEVDVDSHAICHAMAEKPHIEVLEALDGAYALVWHDSRTNMVYATRNNERPLTIFELDDYYMIVSEAELGKWIAARNIERILRTVNVTPGTVYAFTPNPKKGKLTLTTQTYKMKPPPPIAKVTSHLSHYYGQQRMDDLLNGLEIGQRIELLPFKLTELMYVPVGKNGRYRWDCESLDHSTDIRFEVYTDERTDLHEKLITAEVMSITYSTLLETYYVTLKDPQLHKLELTNIDHQHKKKDDATGPITSSNGVLLTPEVIQQCQHNQCAFCEAPFTEYQDDPDTVLIPYSKHGHVYRYQFYCPHCAEKFSISGFYHQRRMHH